MSTTNMELWNRVSKTDPHHVKPITGKQYSGNSPKPYYIVQRLTEEFGPCGIGWGFEVVSERFERFSDTDTLHVALVSFWYEMEGSPRRAVFQQMGQTKASYVTNSGKFMLDEDAPKKSVTDALVKCASYLGFAGDIFSGRWDDSKYVESLKREFSEREPESSLEDQLRASIALAKQRQVESIAQDMRELYSEGKHTAVCAIWYGADTFKDNDERINCWGLLKDDSALRAMVKANNPHHEEPDAPKGERAATGAGLKKTFVKTKEPA